jgi:formyl-CoA transferase
MPRTQGAMQRPISYQLLRDKELVDLDLKSEVGRDALAVLVRDAHVVIENFSSGTLDRLGVGLDWLQRINPAVSLVSIRALTTGTDLDRIKAGAPSIQAMTGVDDALGLVDGEPLALGRPTGDMVAGLNAAAACISATRRAAAHGVGAHLTVGIDRSLWQLFFAALGDADTTAATAPRTAEGGVPSGFYGTADGSWIALSCTDDAGWLALAEVVGGAQLRADPRFADGFLRRVNADALAQTMAEWCAEQSVDEVMTALSAAGASCQPVLAPAEQLTSSLFASRGSIEWRPDELVGGHPVVLHRFGRLSSEA